MRHSEEKGFKYGFIAQEIQTILPDLIRNNGIDDGEGGSYKSLEYNSIIAILTKAIQEQQSIIEDLKFRILALEGGNPELEEVITEEPVAKEAPVEESVSGESSEAVSLSASISSTSLDEVSDLRAEETTEN